MIDYVILVLAGIGTGFLNVMAGGGSLLSVPIMIFLGVPGPVANGTNRIALLPQNLTAIWAFYRKGFANLGLSLSLALATLPGALIGAYLATKIDNSQFNHILVLVMLLVLITMALPQHKLNSHTNQISMMRLAIGHFLMVLIGFWGGFIHIGVGFLLMPVLNRVLQLDLITTNAHKVFIVFTYTVAALILFASQLDLIWQYGIALAIGTSIGAWIAANTQITHGIGMIKWTLNLVVIVFIIKLLFF